ncbi:MAG: pseudouridine synthase [Gammaproteobacteria bacterium]|nr:MAG: pseudouridine synthase [Gammaproteobacteria bacterium]
MSKSNHNPAIILFNKPYGVQSQFRNDKGNNHATLADYFTDKSLRIAGRLDANSEGLLVLTGSSKLDGQINRAITHPPKALTNTTKKQGKTYLVQVEGKPSAKQLAQLTKGVVLKDGKTLPAKVRHILEHELPMPLWERKPAIRERKNIPTAWLVLTIYEGKNRQVRRMTAHVGLPCLRLIRWSVAGFELGNLAVGQSRRVELNDKNLRRLGIP